MEKQTTVHEKVEVCKFEKETLQFLDAMMVWFDLVTHCLSNNLTEANKKELLDLEWNGKRDKFGLKSPLEITTWQQLSEYLNCEETDELFNEYGYHGACCAFAEMAIRAAKNS